MTQNHFVQASAAQALQVLGAPEGTDRHHNAPISLSASEDETLEAARAAWAKVSLWSWDRDPEMVALGWPPPVYIRKRKYRGRKLLEKFKALLLRRAIKARGT